MNESIKTTRTLVGQVISNKMQKTINVMVERKVPHPKYKKYVTRRSKILAHDEAGTCQIGDWVTIKEHRRLSKRKSWVLVNIVKKGTQSMELNS